MDLPAVRGGGKKLFETIATATLIFFGAPADAAKLAAYDPIFKALARVVDLRTPGGPGLAAVAERALGAPLDKALQTADWAARPLSAAAVAYAALDAHVLLQLAARADFPAPGLSPDDVAPLAAPIAGAAVIKDPPADAALAKTLALVDARGRRVLAVLEAGATLADDYAAAWKLAPAASLVARFGFGKGALGPLGPHRGATVVVDDALAGRVVALGCGAAGASLVVAADALVDHVRADRAPGSRFAALARR